MIRVIRARPVDHVHIETSFSAVCPVDHSVDNYVVEIDYKPACNGDDCAYIELGSLREYLDGFRDRVIYHEDVINELLSELMRVLAPVEVSITLTSNYRGIKYVIKKGVNTRSPQHAP